MNTNNNSVHSTELTGRSLDEIVYFSQHKFHGGVHPKEHKTLSNQSNIQALEIPPELIIPLNQHSGRQAMEVVAVGDQVKAGQLIAAAEGDLSANIHASSSGKVIAIEDRPIAHPSGMRDRCIVIATDGCDEAEWLPPIEHPFKADKQQLLRRIQECGIVGMGGASFPSHIKLMPEVNKLVINAAECEPYITCDDRLMREQANTLIAGIQLVMHLLNASEAIIGIEDNKPEAIAELKKTIKDAQTSASDKFAQNTSDLKNSSIKICVVPTKYPSGGEKQLIELITGKQVPSQQLPLALGLVMHNVATIYAIYQAITQGRPLISRVMTITGDAAQLKGNYLTRIGTPISFALQQAKVESCDKVIMGGPMMGFEIFDTQAPVIKSSNCLIAAGKGELKATDAALACIRCGECADACPASLLPQQLYWFARSDDLEKAEQYNLFDCIECGACSYVCPSDIPLVQYYRYAKNELVQRAEEKQKAAHARERFEFREYRKKREKAERAERHKKAAEARKKAAQQKGQADEKKATIADAVARAKARKKSSD